MAKSEIKREDLIDKKLEELILSKDEQHDLISIYVPLIFTLIGIIAPGITSVNPEILTKCPILGIFITIIRFISIIAVIVIPFIIMWRHKIIKRNLKVYDEVILEKLEEYKKSNEEYKKEISDSLNEIKKVLNNQSN